MMQLLAFLLTALPALSHPVGDAHNNAIQLPSGRYIGRHDPEACVTTYFAVPYAKAARFELPTPIDEADNLTPDAVINASQHGAACINFNLPPPYDEGFGSLLGSEPLEPQSEDCLTMDISVPDGEHGDLPVLFYTPGGGFLVGASFTYLMTPLVARSLVIGQPVIAVSINYRLGPLGFLNTQAWQDDEKINLGMLDQIEALRFVKKYIHRFGGDAEKVTISGESAGGDSAMQQLLWTDEHLFRSAWLMSVPSTDGPFIEPEPHFKDDLVKDYAKAAGCNDIRNDTDVAVECLRELPVEVLVNASAAWQGSGSSSGGFIKERAFDAIAAGHFPEIPLVLSVCRDEGTNTAIGFKSDNDSTTSLVLYNYISGRELSPRDGQSFIKDMLSAYPIDPALGAPFDGRNTTYGEPSQYKRMAAIVSDAQWTAAWHWYLDTFSQKTNVWGIQFEEPIPGERPALGVQHGSDLAFYFPELFGQEKDPRENGYGGLVDTIHDALIRFVHFGDPNGGGDGDCEGGTGDQWPEYGESGLVTALNASHLASAIRPPYRPGFEVIERYLIE